MTNLDRIRERCMAMPGATEDYPWEHVAFKVGGKLFAITSDPANRMTVCSTIDRQAALIQDPAIEVAAYIGRHGWVAIDLTDPEMMDTALELAEDSYRLVVSKFSKKKQVELGSEKPPL